MKFDIYEIEKAWLDGVIGKISRNEKIELEDLCYDLSRDQRQEIALINFLKELRAAAYSTSTDTFRIATSTGIGDYRIIFGQLVPFHDTFYIDFYDKNRDIQLCTCTVSKVSVFFGDDYIKTEIRDTQYYYNNKSTYERNTPNIWSILIGIVSAAALAAYEDNNLNPSSVIKNLKNLVGLT